MAIRSLLHKTKMDAFIKWCDVHGIKIRPGKGSFQVLQVFNHKKELWGAIYEKIDSKEHYSVDKNCEYTVQKFISSTKTSGVANNNFDTDKQ